MGDLQQGGQLARPLFHALLQQLLRLYLLSDITYYRQQMRFASIRERSGMYFYVERRSVFARGSITHLELTTCSYYFKRIYRNLLSVVTDPYWSTQHLLMSVAPHLASHGINLDRVTIFQINDQ